MDASTCTRSPVWLCSLGPDTSSSRVTMTARYNQLLYFGHRQRFLSLSIQASLVLERYSCPSCTRPLGAPDFFSQPVEGSSNPWAPSDALSQVDRFRVHRCVYGLNLLVVKFARGGRYNGLSPTTSFSSSAAPCSCEGM